jgi:hypothetical protein
VLAWLDAASVDACLRPATLAPAAVGVDDDLWSLGDEATGGGSTNVDGLADERILPVSSLVKGVPADPGVWAMSGRWIDAKRLCSSMSRRPRVDINMHS